MFLFYMLSALGIHSLLLLLRQNPFTLLSEEKNRGISIFSKTK